MSLSRAKITYSEGSNHAGMERTKKTGAPSGEWVTRCPGQWDALGVWQRTGSVVARETISQPFGQRAHERKNEKHERKDRTGLRKFVQSVHHACLPCLMNLPIAVPAMQDRANQAIRIVAIVQPFETAAVSVVNASAGMMIAAWLRASVTDTYQDPSLSGVTRIAPSPWWWVRVCGSAGIGQAARSTDCADNRHSSQSLGVTAPCVARSIAICEASVGSLSPLAQYRTLEALKP